MRGWITTDPLLSLAPGGLYGHDAPGVNPWLARGGLLFAALDRGIECLAFHGESARRIHLNIQSIPGTNGLTSDQTYYNVRCVDVSRDGRMLALALRDSPYVVVYDTFTWTAYAQPTTLPASKASSVAFSPDGTMLAVTHVNSPYVTIYNTGDWSKIGNPSTLPAGTGAGVAWSPDGAYLAVGHANSPYMLVYHTSDWSVAYTATELASAAAVVAWSPNGQYLAAVVTVAPNLHVFTVSNWSRNQPTANAGNRVCAWAPDSSRLYCSSSGAIYYTEPGTWGSTTVKTGFQTSVRSDAVSPDGVLVAFSQAAAPYVGLLRVSDGTVLDTPTVFATTIRGQCWHRFPRP